MNRNMPRFDLDRAKAGKWRSQPPTPGQKMLLKKHGLDIPGTKGEASEMLNKVLD